MKYRAIVTATPQQFQDLMDFDFYSKYERECFVLKEPGDGTVLAEFNRRDGTCKTEFWIPDNYIRKFRPVSKKKKFDMAKDLFDTYYNMKANGDDSFTSTDLLAKIGDLFSPDYEEPERQEDKGTW